MVVNVSYSAQELDDSTYFGLYKDVYDDLSLIYENESMPAYDIFLEAEGNASRCPYISYSKLIKCYGMLSWDNIKKLMDSNDNDTVCEILSNGITNKMMNVTEKMNFTSQTVASAEWYLLVEDCIQNANALISDVSGSELIDIQTLYVVDIYLENANYLIEVSMEKNLPEGEYEMDTVRLVAQKWIEETECYISFTNVTDDGKLVQAKKLYDDGRYYLSLMIVAEAKGLAEYMYSSFYVNNRDNALDFCRTILDYVDKIMLRVYIDDSIDAPLSEENIEKAKDYLIDAENEENEGGSMAYC